MEGYWLAREIREVVVVVRVIRETGRMGILPDWGRMR
jgi:hypothetical protein